MLNTIIHGEKTDKPTLLIAHGLFGSGRNWGVIAKRLSDERQVVAVDMRNHGHSPWDDEHTYPAMAADLAEVIDGQWDVLGHSMGGKAAMSLALTYPDKVRRLVVADVSPVPYSHDQNQNIQYMRRVDIDTLETRKDAYDALGDLSGLNAVIVGRSNIVGKPMAQLLLNESCTVTVAHSRTRDLPALCRTADILVAAVGRPEMIGGDWLKPGATVIDVGINRVPSADPAKAAAGKTRVVGDVAFEEAMQVAGRITPVPGGVGPMTIACLLANTYSAACRSIGVAPEPLDA